MKLRRENFDLARAYLMREGRSLEQTLFRYFFENGSATVVADALQNHQAPGGGFVDMGEGGRERPSPMGSSVAFQHLVDIGMGHDCPLVKKGIDYFMETYDEEYDAWPQKEGDQEFLSNELVLHWGNPGAEIVGCLWRYSERVPRDFLQQVSDEALSRLAQAPLPIAPFTGLCYLRMAKHLPDKEKACLIVERVRTRVEENLETDRDKWSSWCMKPYWYALTPEEPLYVQLSEVIGMSLDHEIGSQTEHGNFPLTFDHVDEIEKRTWRSIWTLEILRVLKAHNRIEEA